MVVKSVQDTFLLLLCRPIGHKPCRPGKCIPKFSTVTSSCTLHRSTAPPCLPRYTGCTTAPPGDRPWCSTATDNSGNHITGLTTSHIILCLLLAITSWLFSQTPQKHGHHSPRLQKYLHWSRLFFCHDHLMVITITGDDSKVLLTHPDLSPNSRHHLGNWGNCDTTTCPMA